MSLQLLCVCVCLCVCVRHVKVNLMLMGLLSACTLVPLSAASVISVRVCVCVRPFLFQARVCTATCYRIHVFSCLSLSKTFMCAVLLSIWTAVWTCCLSYKADVCWVRWSLSPGERVCSSIRGSRCLKDPLLVIMIPGDRCGLCLRDLASNAIQLSHSVLSLPLNGVTI